jgi:hypothetical protein
LDQDPQDAFPQDLDKTSRKIQPRVRSHIPNPILEPDREARALKKNEGDEIMIRDIQTDKEHNPVLKIGYPMITKSLF